VATTTQRPTILLRDGLLDDHPVDLLIADGSVTEIGTDLSADDATEVVPLGGRRVLPGLRDAHVHFTTWALQRTCAELNRAISAAPSAADVAAAVAAATPTADGWIRGAGFHAGRWADVTHKDLLDRAAPGVPVVLTSHDVHSGWWSSAALAAIGWDHGTGYLREEEAWRAAEAAPPLRTEVVDAAIRDAIDAAAARGVTAIVDYELAGAWDEWCRRAERWDGPLGLRVEAGIARSGLDGAVEAGLETGHHRGPVCVGRLKLFADGALGSRTAACMHEYDGDPGNRGMALLDHEHLARLIGRATDAGIDTTVHAIGDAANRLVLDVYERLGVHGRVEHAQMVAPEDVPRFAALGVTASVQPTHATDDRDLVERWWGSHADRAYPLRSLYDSGAEVIFGSDAPVSDLDPWHAIAAAVARTTDERPPWQAEEAVSLERAVASTVVGRLEVGAPADLVVVDEDPFDLDLRDLAGVPVWATMVAGSWTHRSG
jgi:predicted amidohydrolase YtcJ